MATSDASGRAPLITPSSMLLAHVDAVLGSSTSARHPYDAQTLAQVINLYAIFHDHLVIGDVSIVYNAPLCTQHLYDDPQDRLRSR